MTYSRAGVREGYATVTFGDRGKLLLKGVPVMGRSKTKGLIEREVLISKEAPAWFSRLCYDCANTDFKIKIRITAVYGENKAYAVPVASSLSEALGDSRNTVKIATPDTEVFDLVAYDYAVKAHEHVMGENELVLVRHTLQGVSVRTIAMKPHTGEKFIISGGTIVSKLKGKIDSGELSWEQQLRNYVRVRPALSPQLV